MKDPCRNPSLISSFSFTGTIVDIAENGKVYQLQIHQEVADGRLPTDFKLLIPRSAVPDAEFQYANDDTVMVEDALVYIKDSEVRLRIDSMSCIRGSTAQPGELNTLSFSGKIVDVKEEDGYSLVLMKQTVKDHFETELEVVIPNSVRPEHKPKIGDIGLIHSAILYEKGGGFRARITRPTYLVLYTPDIVMNLGTIEAKEKFI